MKIIAIFISNAFRELLLSSISKLFVRFYI